MMKVSTTVKIILSYFAAAYGAGAFAFWNVNPSAWGADDRGMIAAFLIAASFLTAGIRHISPERER